MKARPGVTKQDRQTEQFSGQSREGRTDVMQSAEMHAQEHHPFDEGLESYQQ